MRICITGASGLLGSALSPFLTAAGHEVLRLTRKPTAGDRGRIAWDPMQSKFSADALDGVDAVVHLAGENLAAGRWTEAKKRRILDSRVAVTRLLCESLIRLPRPPQALLSASAVGIYGSRGDAVLDESSSLGNGFLAGVCRRWEEATEPARNAGIRVTRLRFGAILTPRGGMFAKMLPLFRLCLGGRLGNGRQWQSWIAIDDAVAAIQHALTSDSLDGPVNLVSPQPVTNAQFTKTLATVLHRPAFLPAPRWALRAALGEMADELLLSSTRAVPTRLLRSGYTFRYATLTEALKHILAIS